MNALINNTQNLAAPVGRLFLALIFFMSGLTKITQFEGTQAYMEMMGVSGALLPLVIIAEVVLGLAVIVGFKARLSALLLAGFSILAAVVFHSDFSNQMEITNFLKNISISGGFLLIAAHGAGSFALDNRNRNNA